HMTKNWTANQGEIANQIERLVTTTFIRKAQSSRIQYALRRKAECAIERSSPDQTHFPHLIQVSLEAERPRRSDLRSIALRCHFRLDRLLAYRLRKVDLVSETERLLRKDRDALRAIFDRDGPAHAQIFPLASKLPDAG